MKREINRRELLKFAAAGGAACLAGPNMLAFGARPQKSKLISPGCRRSKVKVAKIYMGIPQSHYPNPDLDLKKEVRFYESEFAKLKNELADVEFVVDQLISSVEQLNQFKDKLKDVDGILAIHLTLWTMPIINEILKLNLPTIIFSAPYSGHEWHTLTSIYKQPQGRNLECILTSDHSQLAAAIKPFRAIHHLREAKILNLTTQPFNEYADQMKNKFGTEIKPLELQRVLNTCKSVSDTKAQVEADRWIKRAVQMIEPTSKEIFKSCKLALAFEKLLDEEDATVMAVDCYGTMYAPLCQAYAFPCIGFTRLNDMGLGGICQSDLPCAMTHILFQGLSGRPGFVNNPGFDFSTNSAVLIHCMGTTKMDGPDGHSAPYKLRSVMERREGAVPQVKMRIGQKVTQAVLMGSSKLLYFTGQIVNTPETNRGCRTKITVKVDGDAEKLWKNWANGIHRVTCYGDITKELQHFCRFKQIEMINEAV
ncbi:MAG: twin-arginine translocation signal domain-containing protein [Planctomycetota bacterium]